MTDIDTQAAVARLLAESEIRTLIGRIAHLSDDGDLDTEYASLYTEDGSWGTVNGEVRYRGRAEIVAAAKERRTNGAQGPGSGLLHMNASLWISVDSPTEAHAESYWMVVSTKGEQGTVVSGAGRYLDTFRRTPDGWKFADRTVVLNVT